jgi:hypothetical protein
MKINFANRQQLLGTFAIGFVVLWAADKMIIEPGIGLWKARAKRINQLKDSVQQGEYTLKNQRYITGNFDNVRTNTLPLDTSLAYGQALQAIDRWAREGGVSVNSKRPQWRRGDDPSYSTLECGVDATGNLDNIARFLYQIEDDSVGAKISAIDISTRDNSGGQLTLALQLSFLQIANTNQ